MLSAGAGQRAPREKCQGRQGPPGAAPVLGVWDSGAGAWGAGPPLLSWVPALPGPGRAQGRSESRDEKAGLHVLTSRLCWAPASAVARWGPCSPLVEEFLGCSLGRGSQRCLFLTLFDRTQMNQIHSLIQSPGAGVVVGPVVTRAVSVHDFPDHRAFVNHSEPWAGPGFLIKEVLL